MNNNQEHEWHVAEELPIIIDQDRHVVTGYVVCALTGFVKPFACEEVVVSSKPA